MPQSLFDSIRHINGYEQEYWSARELQIVLGYDKWERFEWVIERAIESCKNSKQKPQDHFARAGKMVSLGSWAQRELADYELSRYACYLIAQNGDPRKTESAQAQGFDWVLSWIRFEKQKNFSNGASFLFEKPKKSILYHK